MTTIIQYDNGMLEDAADDAADELLRAGVVSIVGRRPETTMLAAPETAMLPVAAPIVIARKKPQKGKKKR